MIGNSQTKPLIENLENQYPKAFKYNYILYAQIKTKGMLDESKEFIPWILALMIFVSIYFCFGKIFQQYFHRITEFQAYGISLLNIMCFMMFITPVILKQMKHSSHSCYQHLKNTPFKLSVLIVLQAINIAYIESTLLQFIFFFFCLSFGFVKFYKENLFRADTQNDQLYYLQQIRRVCYWSYKQIVKSKLKCLVTSTSSPKYETYQNDCHKFENLHLQLMQVETQYCKNIKFSDVEDYLDELMK